MALAMMMQLVDIVNRVRYVEEKLSQNERNISSLCTLLGGQPSISDSGVMCNFGDVR